MVLKTTTIPMLLSIIFNRIERIEMYTHNVSLEEYLQNLMMQDACERNLEIIGDSCNIITKRSEVENFKLEKDVSELFKNIYGSRNFLSHGYDELDSRTTFLLMDDGIPELKQIILKLQEVVR